MFCFSANTNKENVKTPSHLNARVLIRNQIILNTAFRMFLLFMASRKSIASLQPASHMSYAIRNHRSETAKPVAVMCIVYRRQQTRIGTNRPPTHPATNHLQTSNYPTALAKSTDNLTDRSLSTGILTSNSQTSQWQLTRRRFRSARSGVAHFSPGRSWAARIHAAFSPSPHPTGRNSF